MLLGHQNYYLVAVGGIGWRGWVSTVRFEPWRRLLFCTSTSDMLTQCMRAVIKHIYCRWWCNNIVLSLSRLKTLTDCMVTEKTKLMTTSLRYELLSLVGICIAWSRDVRLYIGLFLFVTSIWHLHHTQTIVNNQIYSIRKKKELRWQK